MFHLVTSGSSKLKFRQSKCMKMLQFPKLKAKVSVASRSQSQILSDCEHLFVWSVLYFSPL